MASYKVMDPYNLTQHAVLGQLMASHRSIGSPNAIFALHRWNALSAHSHLHYQRFVGVKLRFLHLA